MQLILETTPCSHSGDFCLFSGLSMGNCGSHGFCNRDFPKGLGFALNTKISCTPRGCHVCQTSVAVSLKMQYLVLSDKSALWARLCGTGGTHRIPLPGRRCGTGQRLPQAGSDPHPHPDPGPRIPGRSQRCPAPSRPLSHGNRRRAPGAGRAGGAGPGTPCIPLHPSHPIPALPSLRGPHFSPCHPVPSLSSAPSAALLLFLCLFPTFQSHSPSQPCS